MNTKLHLQTRQSLRRRLGLRTWNQKRSRLDWDWVNTMSSLLTAQERTVASGLTWAYMTGRLTIEEERWLKNMNAWQYSDLVALLVARGCTTARAAVDHFKSIVAGANRAAALPRTRTALPKASNPKRLNKGQHMVIDTVAANGGRLSIKRFKNGVDRYKLRLYADHHIFDSDEDVQDLACAMLSNYSGLLTQAGYGMDIDYSYERNAGDIIDVAFNVDTI